MARSSELVRYYSLAKMGVLIFFVVRGCVGGFDCPRLEVVSEDNFSLQSRSSHQAPLPFHGIS